MSSEVAFSQLGSSHRTGASGGEIRLETNETNIDIQRYKMNG